MNIKDKKMVDFLILAKKNTYAAAKIRLLLPEKIHMIFVMRRTVLFIMILIWAENVLPVRKRCGHELCRMCGEENL